MRTGKGIGNKARYLCHAVLDHFLACKVRLVPYQQLVNTFRRVSVNFLKPLLDIRESVYEIRLVTITERR